MCPGATCTPGRRSSRPPPDPFPLPLAGRACPPGRQADDAPRAGLSWWQFGGQVSVLPGNDNTVNWLAAGTRVAVLTGLNPGLHTFTCVYRIGVGFPEVSFNGRSMAVIAL